MVQHYSRKMNAVLSDVQGKHSALMWRLKVQHVVGCLPRLCFARTSWSVGVLPGKRTHPEHGCESCI